MANRCCRCNINETCDLKYGNAQITSGCVPNKNSDIKENYGAFSIAASVRLPFSDSYGCGCNNNILNKEKKYFPGVF